MTLHIENRGKGFIGEIGDGWRITQNGSPAILGQSPGRLGSLSFSAACDETSKFTIDNYLSVQHFFDDQVNRWLSTFDGHIRSVDVQPSVTGERFGQFEMSSLLSALDVERTSSADPSGTFQRSFDLPVMEYQILGVTYTTGGYWTSVGSENVFVPRPIEIYDVTSNEHYIYVLASGQHNGEVVFIVGIDGIPYGVWPVYSDSIDLSAPNSSKISYADGDIYIGQGAAKRVKKFTVLGTFVLQWGSSGSGDGQFNAISGIAANGYTFNAVYVTDSVLGRVQCFAEDGTFLFKWGTSGTGVGDTVFNRPNNVSIDPKTDNVFVSDENARVRAYTSGGGFVAQVMGSIDLATHLSTGEFLPGRTIKTDFDHLGNAYAIQQGKIFKYARANGGWAASSGKPIKEWGAVKGTISGITNIFTITPGTGIMHVCEFFGGHVEQYAASLGGLQSYFLYYIALAGPNIPVRILVLNDPWVAGELVFPAWTGNVWDHLCQLLAVTDNAMLAYHDRLLFVNRESPGFILPDDVQVDTLQIDSRAAGRAVEIVNQNSRYTAGQEVLYSAEADGQRTFSVDINSLNYVTVSQNTYPEFVNDPIPDTVIADGHYIVIDKNGLVVTPSLWTNYGGAIRADVGEKPGTIVLTIVGPGLEIPGFESPYKVSTVGAQASLSVTGAGVVTVPEVFTVGTGVSGSVTNREVAQTIDSPFVMNASIAYSEGSWAAYDSGTPDQRISFTFKNSKTLRWLDDASGILGTAFFINMLVQYEDAQYIVEGLDYNNNDITLTCYRYSLCGLVDGGQNTGPRFEEIWAGLPAAEFEAYWSEYTAEDVTIAPLRNPFGV